MSEKIKLVQGDTRPQVKVNLTDDTTGAYIDLQGAVVRLKFRAAGDTTILSNFQGVITDTLTGEVVFPWPQGSLDVPAGQYEGEIEITFSDTTVQTVYEPIKFLVREQF